MSSHPKSPFPSWSSSSSVQQGKALDKASPTDSSTSSPPPPLLHLPFPLADSTLIPHPSGPSSPLLSPSFHPINSGDSTLYKPPYLPHQRPAPPVASPPSPPPQPRSPTPLKSPAGPPAAQPVEVLPDLPLEVPLSWRGLAPGARPGGVVPGWCGGAGSCARVGGGQSTWN